MKLKNQIGKFVIFLILLSIFILPRLYLDRIRLEDIVSPLLILLVIIYNYKSNFKLFNIYFWFVFSVTTIGLILAYIPIQGFVIFLKELQYFIFGVFLFSFFINEKNKQFVDKTILIFSISTIVYGLYQLISGTQAYYGIRAINEISPSLSAWTINILLFYMSSKDLLLSINRKYIFLINSLLFLLVIFVGSRTGLVIGVIFYLRYIFITSSFKKTFPVAIIAILIAIAVAPVYFPNFLNTLNRYATFSSTESISEGYNPRRESFEWRTKDLYKLESAYSVLFGYGRGFGNMDPEAGLRKWRGFSMVVDSMYLRNYLEIGLLGSLLFLIALLYTSFRYFDRPTAICVLLALLLSFFSMESWLISKPGFFFWLMLARFHKK